MILLKSYYHYGRCLLTACPSSSTAQMLNQRGISSIRIWSRGVDLQAFGPHRRSEDRRHEWGIEKPGSKKRLQNYVQKSLEGGLIAPITPPPSPPFGPIDRVSDGMRNHDIVILYVGRM